jgi:hypothetical protein
MVVNASILHGINLHARYLRFLRPAVQFHSYYGIKRWSRFVGHRFGFYKCIVPLFLLSQHECPLAG